MKYNTDPNKPIKDEFLPNRDFLKSTLPKEDIHNKLQVILEQLVLDKIGFETCRNSILEVIVKAVEEIKIDNPCVVHNSYGQGFDE